MIKLMGGLIPLILSPFVARALLSGGLGEYTYAHSIVSYFSLFVSFGFVNYGTKKISEVRDNPESRSHAFWHIIYARFLLFILASITYVILILSFDLTKGFNNEIYFVLYLTLVGALVDLTFYFQGIEKMFGFSIVNLTINCIYMFLIIFLVKSPSDLFLYTLLKSSLLAVSSIFSLPLIINQIKNVPRPNFKEIKCVFVGSFAFFIPSLILTITPLIDQTMLGAIANTDEVGYYEAANKIKIIALVFSSSISSILLSRVSYMRTKNDDINAFLKVSKSLLFSIYILVPMVFGVCAVSDVFFVLYFGIDFSQSEIIMYWLSPSILFSSIITILLFGYFFACGKTKASSLIILGCDLLNAITNIAAIKYLGASGAAITSSFSNGILMALCIWFSKRDIDYRSIFKNSSGVFVNSIVMFFVVCICKTIFIRIGLPSIFVLFISILIGATCFFLACIAIKEFNTNQVFCIFKNHYKKKKNNTISREEIE